MKDEIVEVEVEKVNVPGYGYRVPYYKSKQVSTLGITYHYHELNMYVLHLT